MKKTILLIGALVCAQSAVADVAENAAEIKTNRAGTAIGLSLTVVPPAANKTFSVTPGIGEFDGVTGVGITAAGKVTDSLVLFGGHGIDNDSNNVTKVGVNFQW